MTAHWVATSVDDHKLDSSIIVEKNHGWQILLKNVGVHALVVVDDVPVDIDWVIKTVAKLGSANAPGIVHDHLTVNFDLAVHVGHARFKMRLKVAVVAGR